MANNYMQFSEKIDGLTPEMAEWVERVLCFDGSPYRNDENEDNYLAALADLLGVKLEELVDVDVDFWPNFDWQVGGAEKSSLWLKDNGESFGFDELMLFVHALIKKWMPDYIFTMTWAGTCSKHRLGEFGGGWAMVTKDVVDYEDTWAEVNARVKKYQKEEDQDDR